MIPLIFYLEVIPKNENGERHLVIGSAIWNELIDWIDDFFKLALLKADPRKAENTYVPMEYIYYLKFH